MDRFKTITDELFECVWPFCEVGAYRVKLAGIDVGMFKIHSTRADSTSKANAIGHALGKILERGSCFNASYGKDFTRKILLPQQ